MENKFLLLTRVLSTIAAVFTIKFYLTQLTKHVSILKGGTSAEIQQQEVCRWQAGRNCNPSQQSPAARRKEHREPGSLETQARPEKTGFVEFAGNRREQLIRPHTSHHNCRQTEPLVTEWLFLYFTSGAKTG
jgi:hypothetical protein